MTNERIWQIALCARRKELDVLGVGAYDGDRLVGLGGADGTGNGFREKDDRIKMPPEGQPPAANTLYVE